MAKHDDTLTFQGACDLAENNMRYWKAKGREFVRFRPKVIDKNITRKVESFTLWGVEGNIDAHGRYLRKDYGYANE